MNIPTQLVISIKKIYFIIVYEFQLILQSNGVFWLK